MNTLLTRAFKSKDFSFVFSFPEILMNDFETEIVSWIRNYVSKYDSLPSYRRFKREFPIFSPIGSRDPTKDILDECLLRKKQTISQSYASKVIAMVQDGDDPTSLFEEAYGVLSTASSSILKYSTFDRSVYFKKQKFLKFGIEVFDMETGGLGIGELCYIAGRLGSYKTTLTEFIAFKWWLSGARVLFVSNEALPSTVFAHLDSIAGSFNPSVLRRPNVPSEIKKKISLVALQVLKNKAHTYGEIIIPSERLMAPAQVFSVASQLKVDAIVIDGVYLMHPDDHKVLSQNWESMTLVSRALKQGAMNLKTRVIGIVQRKRGSGEKQSTEDIAYSDAFPQDADIAISLYTEGNEIVAELIKNREGRSNVGTILSFDHEKRRIKDLKINTHDIQEIKLDDQEKTNHVN